MGEASAHAEVVVRSRGWVTGRISYLPAVATLRDGELRVVSHASRRGGRPAYDKTMAVPRGTSTAGRPGARTLSVVSARRAGGASQGAPHAARAAPRVGRAHGRPAPRRRRRLRRGPRGRRGRDFTFASLGRSVAYLARGGGVASVGDAALALVAVKCVRLVGLVPHALGELARLKRERANLKRFAFGALQLRLPLLSAVVCDLLAALCKEKEGLRVVDAVWIASTAPRFGDARSPAPLRASGAHGASRDAALAALADLLNARRRRARRGAARLFAATCDAEDAAKRARTACSARSARTSGRPGEPRGPAAAGASGGDPACSRRSRMDGDLVFGDGLADLDARMTRTVADAARRAGGAASRPAPRCGAGLAGAALASLNARANAPAAARDDPRLERYARMLNARALRRRARKWRRKASASLLARTEPPYQRSAARGGAVLAKYLKMLQMHVPRGAVENKMRADGWTRHSRRGFIVGRAAAASTSRPGRRPPGPAAGLRRKPRVKTRRVYLDYASDDSARVATGGAARQRARSASADLRRLRPRGPRRKRRRRGGAEKAQPASKKRSLVSELFGDRRALELNVLHGNVRARDDAVVETLLTPTAAASGPRARRRRRASSPSRPSSPANRDPRSRRRARGGFRDADAARLLAPSLDAPSALFAVVACGVPRCAAKVGYLWLEATYADRCAELVDGGVAPLKTAANQLAGSYGLRDVLRTALGVANFANHGTARAQRPGVRTSALGKLREARSRGGGAESANLLQYVARHARVKPQVLRRELGGLADAAQATSRDALAEELHALTAERHGADAERERLAAEAPRSRTSPRRARASSRTSTSTCGVARAVDGCLRSYGEDPKTTDFQAWIDDILGFVDAYGKEFEDREEAKLRERRRRASRRQRDSQSGADFTSFLSNVRAGAVLEAEDREDVSDDGWSDDDDEGRGPGAAHAQDAS
ncbi:hypothetical protein JL721_12707 [Aureococcus anophagefferens]|nr:hypothetical protein JL721_12707 [Aureococcus anophagefferens]